MLPFLWKSGDFAIPTYFAIASFAACLALYWVSRRAPQLGLKRDFGIDLTMVVMVSGFLGARLFHVIFEYPALYLENPALIFRFWEGGFVFYGGFLTGFVSGAAFVKWKRESVPQWLDLSAPVISLSYAIGRVGCLLAGCCYGKFCSLPWAISFPRGVEAPAGMPVHPTQVYAFTWEFALLGVLLWLEKRREKGSFGLLQKPGDLFFVWLMFHALGRIIMELYRADFRGDSYWGLSLSIVISLLVMGGAIVAYLKKTGVTNRS